MKKIIMILAIVIAHMPYFQADNMVITNLTSMQATVILDTASKSFTKQVNPNENLYVQQNLDNQSNQYDNPRATLTYDHSQIKKITINRALSDMPQIIYYNGEVTSGNGSTGLYGTFISAGGTLQITENDIKVNNLTYAMNDLSSLKIKCQMLKNQLKKSQNIDDIQKDVNDLSQSLRLIQLSDAVSQVALQVAVIQSDFDSLLNQLQIIQVAKNYKNNVQSMTQSLTSENVDAIQTKLNNALIDLKTINTPTETQNNADQVDQNNVDQNGIQKQLASLQSQITTIKDNLQKTDHTVLINADSPTI